MTEVRVDEPAARAGLSAADTDRLARFARLLLDDPTAPISTRDPAAIRDDHLADSLVALDLPQVRAATTIADLGAGAGLPGLCLAIALPAASIGLVESNARKGRFLTRAIVEVPVPNAAVVTARIEEWRDGIGGCDLVTARALAPLDVVAEYAAPLLRMGGTLVVWRGRRDAEAEAEARAAAEILGLEVADPVPVAPYPGSEHRHLHLMTKVRPTSDRFPRRTGVARKRPLGSAAARPVGPARAEG